jgi:hypothetical protein
MPSKVRVSLGGTVNLGDYNNTRFDFSVETEIPSIKAEDITAEARRLRAIVAAEYANHRKSVKK